MKRKQAEPDKWVSICAALAEGKTLSAEELAHLRGLAREHGWPEVLANMQICSNLQEVGGRRSKRLTGPTQLGHAAVWGKRIKTENRSLVGGEGGDAGGEEEEAGEEAGEKLEQYVSFASPETLEEGEEPLIDIGTGEFILPVPLPSERPPIPPGPFEYYALGDKYKQPTARTFATHLSTRGCAAEGYADRSACLVRTSQGRLFTLVGNTSTGMVVKVDVHDGEQLQDMVWRCPCVDVDFIFTPSLQYAELTLTNQAPYSDTRTFTASDGFTLNDLVEAIWQYLMSPVSQGELNAIGQIRHGLRWTESFGMAGVAPRWCLLPGANLGKDKWLNGLTSMQKAQGLPEGRTWMVDVTARSRVNYAAEGKPQYIEVSGSVSLPPAPREGEK